MSSKHTLNSAVTVAILLLSILPAANYATQLFGGHLGILSSVNATDFAGPTLGIDCGLGSTTGAPNGSPPLLGTPPVTGDTNFDAGCSWAGDADGLFGPADSTSEPLVSDAPSTFPAYGGGFTAEVRLNNLGEAINGFDVTVRYDPKIITGVSFDQIGLFFNPDSPPPGSGGILKLAQRIDNIVGSARLAQTVLGNPSIPFASDGTLFRVRFDVVGVGTSPLTIADDVITRPLILPHKSMSGEFESLTFFDSTNTLGWSVSWSSSPSPEIPGQQLALSAVVSCPNCVGAFTFSWDTNSDGVEDASGVTATLSNPPPPVVNRVVFTVTDEAGNSVKAVRRLPLVLVATGPGTTPVNIPASFSAIWLGGISPYTASYRLCPGTNTPVSRLVCTNPNPTAIGTATADQTDAQSVTYNFAGVYETSLTLTDTASGGQSQTIVTQTIPVTVTGTPQAYTVTVVPDDASPSTGQTVTFTAAIAYDSNYPAYAKSADTLVNGTVAPGTSLRAFPTSGLRVMFCDTAAPGGACVTTGNKLWDPYEWVYLSITTANSATNIVLYPGSGPRPTTGTLTVESPTNHFRFVSADTVFDQLEPVVYDITGNNLFDANFRYTFDFGDGATSTVTGGFTGTAAHSYSNEGTFTINVVAQETGGAGTTGAAISKIQETGSTSVTVGPTKVPLCDPGAGGCDFVVDPASPTTGKPATFTATVNGGTPPYSFSWDFGDGSQPATTNPATHSFSVKGTYTVTLTITDSFSPVQTAQVTHTVTVAAQDVTVTVSCGAATAGKPVTCTATASGGTPPYTFSWSVDGTTQPGETSSSFTTTFPVKGTHTIQVGVTDANSVSASAQTMVNVTAQPLVADFSFAPSSPSSGQEVTFTATVSGGTSAYDFMWDFGDAASGTGNPVTHTYTVTSTRTFTVVLSVRDANGVTDTASHDVTVTLIVEFSVDFGPATATAGQPLTLTATITDGTAPYTLNWDFGDGTSATTTTNTMTSSVEHTYSAKGSPTVSVTVTDSSTPVKTTSRGRTVTVNPAQLVADFTFSPASPIVGQSVSFTATTSGGTSPYNYAWNFGDGTTGSGAQTSHTYSAKSPTGGYMVTLLVTDANVDSVQVTHNVVVAPQPLVADFTFGAATAGKPVSFAAAASGGTSPYTFSWNFGDGTSGEGSPVTHSYSVKGTFTVTLTVTDANGASTTASHQVSVDPQPLEATVTGSAATAGKPVTLTAEISGGTGPYSVSWSFGDGQTGSGNPVTHTYSVKGDYTVVATISDPNGDSVTATVTVSIAPQQLIITASCTDGTAGKPITCTASATGGTGPYTFSWDVGKDGTIDGTGPEFTTSFAVKGTYSIDAIVTDMNDATARINISVEVSGQPLAVDFSVSSASVSVGEQVTFTVTSTTGGTPPYTYSWNFGDGQTATGSEVTHSYTVKGNYNVVLTVTDANIATATATHSVSVSPLPLTADFTFAPPQPTAGKPVTFTATAQGGTTPYMSSWDFGDGTTGTGNPTSHSYASKGSFQVMLTVTDANEATATVSRTLTVMAQALTITDVTVTPSQPLEGQSATLQATITGGTSPYVVVWTFGDGTTGTGNPTSHTWETRGDYTVTVQATDANNVASPAFTITVRVIFEVPQLIVDFAPTRTMVGLTSFVGKISGGTTPYSCSWNFGDGTPSSAGCDASHNYTLSGSFSVTLTVTDATPQVVSTTKQVQVDPAPRFIRGKEHWTHHLTGGTSATQNFIGKVSNPSSFTVEVTITIDIFTDTGTFVARVSTTKTMAPGTTDLAFTVSWTPTMTGKFMFTAALTYKVDFGDLSMPADGVSETITGTDGSKSGSFAVVP